MSVSQVTPPVTRRSYVALSGYNNGLYNYSYGLDEQLLREIGTLTLNPAANSQNCPKGAILHENGRKLNPADGNFRGANDGISTYMVGVYDPNNGLSGFIEANHQTIRVPLHLIMMQKYRQQQFLRRYYSAIT